MKKYLMLILTSICFALISIISIVGVTYSKFVWNENEDIVYVPNSYYFESDLLSESGKTHTLQTNTNQISVTLKNYADELRVSSVDISYQISISKNSSVISSQNGQILTSEKFEKINFTGLSAGTYVITANSTSPYQKTLTATFVIPSQNTNIEINYVDTTSSNVSRLTIVTNDYEGNITVNWVGGIFADNTCEWLTPASGTTHTLPVSKNSSYELVFLKSDKNSTFSASISGNIINIIAN